MAQMVGKTKNIKKFEMSSNIGGMNVSAPPDQLRDIECVELTNFEFDVSGNNLRTRRGVSSPVYTFPGKITKLWFDQVLKRLYIFVWDNDNSKCNIWVYNGSTTPTLVGACTGTNSKPSCINFGGNIFIASGSYLQAILNSPPSYLTNHSGELITLNGSVLGTANEKVATSPVCDIVFQNEARVIVCHTGDDTLNYSSTGDALSETSQGQENHNSNDESGPQWIQIGYKDNGKIIGIYPLSTTLIIFKDNGYIYSMSGSYPNWVVTLIGTKSYVISNNGIINLGNDLVYLSRLGLQTLSTSVDFGNFSQNNLGEKCNSSIKTSISNPWIEHLGSTNQLVISSDSTNVIWVYHYNIKAFSKWEFPTDNTVNDLIDTMSNVYIAIGNSLCTMNQSIFTDYNDAQSKSVDINQRYVSRRVEDDDTMIAYRENIRVTPLTTEIIHSPDTKDTNNYNGHLKLYVNTGVQIDNNSSPTLIKDWYYQSDDPKIQFKSQVKDDRFQFIIETTSPFVMNHLSAVLVVKNIAVINQTAGKVNFDLAEEAEETSPYGYV